MSSQDYPRGVPGIDNSGESIGKASARGGVWAIAAEGIDFFLRLAAVAVLARLLLPEHFGLISMVTAITAVAERFKDAGLSIATVQFREITHAQISTLFWVNLLLGFLIATFIAALSFPIAAFYDDQRLLQITWAIALSFVFGGLTVQHYALLRRTMQFRKIALVQIGASLGSIVLAILVASLGGEYWALVVREVARTAFLLAGTWAAMPWRPGLPRRGSNVRGMLNFGGNLTLSNIVYYVSYSLDQVIIGRMFGAGPLGLYRQGANLITAPAVQIGYPATLVGEPALARLRDRPGEFRSYLRALAATVSFFSMPLLFFVVVYADSVVRVALGPGWEDATTLFRILGLAFFMQPTATLIGCVMIACGFARRTVAMACLHAAILISAFALLARIGPEGVAVAHAATFFVLLVPKLIYGLRGTPATPALFVDATWRPLVFTLITGAVMAAAKQWTSFESSELDLALGLVGGTTIYLALWMIVPQGRADLLSMAARLKSVLKPRASAIAPT